MPRNLELLEAEVLLLPLADRARLVECLLQSLDTDPGIDDAWATEVDRRLEDIQMGRVTMLDGPETLEKLRAEFE